MPRIRVSELRAANSSIGCSHDWKDLPVSGEGRGRIYRCARCGTCGHRMRRFRGGGKIVALTCNVTDGCKCDAKHRLWGRARRGMQFRWACAKCATLAVAKGIRLAT